MHNFIIQLHSYCSGKIITNFDYSTAKIFKLKQIDIKAVKQHTSLEYIKKQYKVNIYATRAEAVADSYFQVGGSTAFVL